MIERFVNYLVKQQVITQDEVEVQTFALVYLTQTLIAHGALFIFAAVFRVLPETILFELIFMPLRCFAGGFHAETQIQCFILSVAVWGLTMYMGSIIPPFIGIAILLIAFIMIWRIAPVPHKNNPVGPIRFAQVKRISRKLVCVDMVVFLLCYAIGWTHYALVISLTLLDVAVSLFAARHKA